MLSKHTGFGYIDARHAEAIHGFSFLRRRTVWAGKERGHQYLTPIRRQRLAPVPGSLGRLANRDR